MFSNAQSWVYLVGDAAAGYGHSAFIRRRPDTYWLYIIIIARMAGCAVYIGAEVIRILA